MIIIQAADVYYVKQVINFLTEMISMFERPKCLCILMSQEVPFQNSTKDVLQFAWENKILDFTILQPSAHLQTVDD